jgi:NADH:ubiquinone oxidoreductase subunit F (NADH-binding)/Fe-S-cluster-containing hydrogenase component 2/(2Fe-2S) ferredoxin
MERLNSLEALKNLRTSLKKIFNNIDRKKVSVCCGTACSIMGSKKICQTFEDELAYNIKELGFEVVKTGCQGLCQKGPVMKVEPYGYFYQKVSYKRVGEIISKTFSSGIPVRRLLYRRSVIDDPIEKMENIPFYGKQVRITLRNNGIIDPCNIYHYIAVGGYAALEKVLLNMTNDQVVEEIKKSNLRGRGGAGFPTGVKWEAAKKAQGNIKLIIANGDEGDPGAFMDRSLMEGDPQSLLEGMIICAYATNARYGFIYVRHEYPLAVKNLKIAIKQAEELGLLGENILGMGFNFTIDIREGAGAFVCGEETALIKSIMGNRGMPMPRPPFPAIKGLWDMPTIINNVETLSQIPHIIMNGADNYRCIGTEKSTGTKVFALTGKVINTGLIEVPMGITLREIIFDIGGGILNNKKFKAVQTGGPSGGCLSEEHLDLPVDYDSLKDVGSMMGSGGMVVMDEDNCMIDVAKFFLSFTQKESCGKCPPCRIGTYQMLNILEKITSGNGKEGDIKRLEKIGNLVKSSSLCGLGKTAPNPVLSTIKYFREEYEEHITDKFCRAKVCSGIGVYRIEGSECYLCGLCKKVCAFGAVKETKNGFYIDQDYCTKCMSCYLICPINAVKIGKEVLPWVIPEQCEGCSDCVDACMVHGLKMYKTQKEGVFLPWLSDPDACVSCGKCAAVCATGGIILTTYIEEDKERFMTKRHKGLVIDDEKNKCKLVENSPGGVGKSDNDVLNKLKK